MKNVFNIQLSWYLIPLLLILWYNYPQSHKIFAILMICIVIIGHLIYFMDYHLI